MHVDELAGCYYLRVILLHRDMHIPQRGFGAFLVLGASSFNCLELSIGSMQERLVLKNAVEALVNVSNGRLEPGL